jgi:hypothetical protein
VFLPVGCKERESETRPFFFISGKAGAVQLTRLVPANAKRCPARLENVCIRNAEYYSLARRQVGSAVADVVRKCSAIVDETRGRNITANALLRVLVETRNFLHH